MILTQKLWVLRTGTLEFSNFLISYPTDVTCKEDWLSSFWGGCYYMNQDDARWSTTDANT